MKNNNATATMMPLTRRPRHHVLVVLLLLLVTNSGTSNTILAEQPPSHQQEGEAPTSLSSRIESLWNKNLRLQRQQGDNNNKRIRNSNNINGNIEWKRSVQGMRHTKLKGERAAAAQKNAAEDPVALLYMADNLPSEQENDVIVSRYLLLLQQQHQTERKTKKGNIFKDKTSSSKSNSSASRGSYAKKTTTSFLNPAWTHRTKGMSSKNMGMMGKGSSSKHKSTDSFFKYKNQSSKIKSKMSSSSSSSKWQYTSPAALKKRRWWSSASSKGAKGKGKGVIVFSPTPTPPPQNTGDQWELTTSLQIETSTNNNNQTQSPAVSISRSGNIFAIGIPNDSSGVGRAQAFRINQNGSFAQLGSDLFGLQSGDAFGADVAVNDRNQLVVGAPHFNNGAGAAIFYEYDASTNRWVDRGVVAGQGRGSRLGASVALAADVPIGRGVAILGEPGFNNRAGRINVLEYDNSMQTWLPGFVVSKNDSNKNFQTGDECGSDVSVSDDGLVLAYGCPGADSAAGIVGIHRRESLSQQTWVLAQVVPPATHVTRSYCGTSIDLSTDGYAFAYGCPGVSADRVPRTGIIYFVSANANGTYRQSRPGIPGLNALGQIGSSIALSGNAKTISFYTNPLVGKSRNGFISTVSYNGMDWEPIGENVPLQTVYGVTPILDLPASKLRFVIGFAQDDMFSKVEIYDFPDPTRTLAPTGAPTPSIPRQPTRIPTKPPTRQPTGEPTRQPTTQLTIQPTNIPGSSVTVSPTSAPTTSPTAKPSAEMTIIASAPTSIPSSLPTQIPTTVPTQPSGESILPSNTPTVSAIPSLSPSASSLPTSIPTSQPSTVPSTSPSVAPSTAPSALPSVTTPPSMTNFPSVTPSMPPSSVPTFLLPVDGRWEQLGRDVEGENEGDQFGVSIDLSADGSILAVGAWRNDDAGEDAGHVRVFRYLDDEWVQIGSDLDGSQETGLFGIKVALSGDGSILAVGAPTTNNDGKTESGSIHVFQFDESDDDWVPLGQSLFGVDFGDRFGISTALSSDGLTLVGSGYWNDRNGLNAGLVQVFRYNEDTLLWEQIGQDLPGEGPEDSFGIAVDLSADGTVLAVGAYFNDDAGLDAGHARVFGYDESTNQWIQLGQDIDGQEAEDLFGFSVALSAQGDIVAVGGYLADAGGNQDGGQVRIFQYSSDGNEWVQLGDEIAGSQRRDRLGWSVALSADGMIVAAGAYLSNRNGNNSGETQIFQYNQRNQEWVQLGQILEGEANDDRFGSAVALSADGLIVASSAVFNAGAGEDAGNVEVYNYNVVPEEQ